jgi:hypothetical protein
MEIKNMKKDKKEIERSINDLTSNNVLRHCGMAITLIKFSEIKKGDIISIPVDDKHNVFWGKYTAQHKPYFSLDLPEGTTEVSVKRNQ